MGAERDITQVGGREPRAGKPSVLEQERGVRAGRESKMPIMTNRMRNEVHCGYLCNSTYL